MPKRPHIVHLIVRLELGGAERSLLRLIEATRSELHHRVICLGTPTPLGREIEALGVVVQWLDYRAGPQVLWRLRAALRQYPVDVLQGWMYWGNLLASLSARSLRLEVPVAWNVRSSMQDLAGEGLKLRWLVKSGAWFRPDLIIYNAYAGQASHRVLGYHADDEVVIANGIDFGAFTPMPQTRARVREQFGIQPQETWVGVLGRLHPSKGIGVYLATVRLLQNRYQEQAQTQTERKAARFFLAGPGFTAGNAVLRGMLTEAGLEIAALDLVGPVDDVPAFLSAVDVLVAPSLREGTPNVLLEAVACGVFTIATDVGDVGRIITDPQRLARPGDEHDLAAKISRVLEPGCSPALETTDAERDRLMQHYSMAQCRTAYLNVYDRLITRRVQAEPD